MKYPEMGRARSYRVSIPQLNGGVNYDVPKTRVTDNQLTDCTNMWWRGGRLKTRPGLENLSSHDWLKDCSYLHDKAHTRFCSFGTYGVFFHKRENGELWADRVQDDKYTGSGFQPTNSFSRSQGAVGSSFWVAKARDQYDGNGALVFDDNTIYRTGFGSDDVFAEEQPYIPVVGINGRPNEMSFTSLEPYNMLTDEAIFKFTTDGVGTMFYTAIGSMDTSYRVKVTYIDNNGTEHHHQLDADAVSGAAPYESTTQGDGYRIVVTKWGGVSFRNESGQLAVLPEAVAPNNVIVTLRRKSDGSNQKRIYSMRFSEWFGGGASGLAGGTRLFVSGSSDSPNEVRWSALNNPLYFPEKNFSYVGDEGDPITAFGKQGDMLVIFKKDSLYCTRYNQGAAITQEDLTEQNVLDVETSSAVFPVYPISPNIGCDLPNTICLCNNKLVWANSRRSAVYGLFSTGLYDERNVRELSLPIRKKI